MNKNRINKKKSGIYSIPLSLVAILFVILFIVGIMTFAKMAIMNREVVEKEVEKGNELIQIFIGVEKKKETSTITTTYTTTSGASTQTITTTSPTVIESKETKIYIKNRWNRASVIDYFVVEGWNSKIISKGEFNPPLILEAGEEIEKDPSDFGLNDVEYEDFGFFKERIRCINLHTKQGNVFSSAYQPVKVGTFTFRYYYVNITQTITTQTFSTTGEKTYKLIIESHGPFDFSNYVNPKDSPYNYNIEGWPVISEGSYAGYIEPQRADGIYTFPAGILVSEYDRACWYHCGSGKVWDDPQKSYIGPYDEIWIYILKWELWEVDENGNEIRLVYQKPHTRLSNYADADSITFTMDANYKLKRFFKAVCYNYAPPPVTTTTKPPPIDVPLYMDFPFFAKDGKLQEDGALYFSGAIFISQEGYLVEWLSPEQVSGETQWLVKKDKNPNVEPLFDTTKPQKYLKFLVEIWWKGNSPPDASITIRIWYKLKPA